MAAALRPYSRSELLEIADQLGGVYRDGEARILRLLGQGSISEWKRDYLNKQLKQIETILHGLEGASRDWAETHVPTVYLHNLRIADQALGSSMGMTAIHQDAMSAIAETLVSDLDHVTGGVGRAVRDVYRQATLGNIQAGLTGGETRRQVSKGIVADLQEKGVTGFTDKAGREWAMSDYAEMVARTTTREASWQGTANRMLEASEDLLQISSHARSCELCEPWQGVVVSMSGETAGYPTLSQAQGEGFGHPNCVHDLLPYVPEAAIPEGE